MRWQPARITHRTIMPLTLCARHTATNTMMRVVLVSLSYRGDQCGMMRSVVTWCKLTGNLLSSALRVPHTHCHSPPVCTGAHTTTISAINLPRLSPPTSCCTTRCNKTQPSHFDASLDKQCAAAANPSPHYDDSGTSQVRAQASAPAEITFVSLSHATPLTPPGCAFLMATLRSTLDGSQM